MEGEILREVNLYLFDEHIFELAQREWVEEVAKCFGLSDLHFEASQGLLRMWANQIGDG
jgi:hypothetical protein